MKQIRKSPPRPGPNARRGGFPDELMPTVYVCAVRPKKPAREVVPDPRPLSEIFAPNAGNQMYEDREKRAKWQKRKDIQRAKAKKIAA